jgi:CheY-like chemotaxis protein
MASLGILSSGVAHEINNSLMTLVGASELGQMSLKSGDASEAQRNFENIAESAQRISQCVTQLQGFGGSSDAKPIRFELNAAVQSTIGLAEHHLRHVAKLETVLEAESTVVFGLESGLGQILMNLLLNAQDAVGNVEEARILVRAYRDGEFAVVTVRDNGPGISPEIAERIFQPFFTTKGENGSGLGLSISVSLARKMGGSLSLDTVDQGAQFSLRIPLAAEEQEVEADPSFGAVEPLASQRVLVVDDEPMVLKVFEQMLRPANVTTAISVEEAKALWDGPYDLILSDIVMPAATGFELRTWIEEHHPEALGHFVFMTGSPVGLEAELRKLPGEQVVLRKPVLRRQILSLFSPRDRGVSSKPR